MQSVVSILSAEDVAAIRKANSVCYRHQGDKLGIDLTFKMKQGKIVKEVKHWIPCPSVIETNRREEVQYTYACYVDLHCGDYCDVWKTVSSFVKDGDALSLLWQADFGSTDLTRAALLHVDYLKLVVDRKGKKHTFLLQVTCCPDNVARMIRRSEY